jgi:hypothetical protein
LALTGGFALAQSVKAPAAYTAPMNGLGQPDLGGNWTNATLTPQTREASLGNRAVYTPEEVKRVEGAQLAGNERGNQATDPNVGAPAVGGIVTPRGGTQIDGNYNRGWFDPGTQIMRVHGEPRTSILTTPDGRTPPAKTRQAAPAGGRPGGPPAGALAGRGGRTDNPENMSLGDRCLISFGRNAGPPMLSNGFYNNNYQIVQSRNHVAIMTEMVHDTRIIRLNSTHRTDGIRPWFGDSIGRYEGKTLVVETTNIPERQAYSGSWRNTKITERFTRVAGDRLLYQFTIEDPDMWDKPWGGEYEFAGQKDQVYEYACAEGNYALEGILAGARAEERKAAETAAKPQAAR